MTVKTQLDSIAESLASIEKQMRHLETIAGAMQETLQRQDQDAPSFERRLADYPNFDWSTIGAFVLEHDNDGATAVEWKNRRWTRRAPANKFGEAIWFSRSAGKDEEGNVQYERLIIFREVSEADPLPSKVKAAVSTSKPTNDAPPPLPTPHAPRPTSDGDFDNLPVHGRSAYVIPQRSGVDKPATETSKQADPEPPAKLAYQTTKRPWTGDTAIEAMRHVADAKRAKGEGVSEQDGKFGAVIGLLDGAPFDTDCRHELLKQVFGVESAKDLDGAQRQALVVWGKPAPVGTGPKAPWALAVEAVAEYRRILGWADSTDAEEVPF